MYNNNNRKIDILQFGEQLINGLLEDEDTEVNDYEDIQNDQRTRGVRHKLKRFVGNVKDNCKMCFLALNKRK